MKYRNTEMTYSKMIRIKSMLPFIHKANRRGLTVPQAAEWMGHRPSMPDSVPVMSRSLRHPAVFYAVGHGHYGLSYAAKTARLVGELIGDATDLSLTAHSITRFNP